MNIIEIIILTVVIIGCLTYIIIYLRRLFKNKGNPCINCPYGDTCKKKNY